MKYPRLRSAAPPLCSVIVLAALPACATLDREVGDRFQDHMPTPWTSPEACDERTPMRGPMSDRAPRVGTWNLLYFPDTEEEREDDHEDATNVGWMACAIANIDVDILAIQELKMSKHALESQAELIQKLNARTGGDWRIEASRCEPTDVQHPGFLYDASRVTGSSFRDLPELSEGACSNRVSPGFAGYFSIPGGPDFHMIAVHTEAYPEERSLESRTRSVATMEAIVQDAYALVPDHDVVFAGDFNTVGCDDCKPKISGEQETETIRSTVAAFEPPLTLLDPSQTCTKPDGGILDHIVVGDLKAELAPGSQAQVGGICQESSCSRLREWYEEATERLSDHCPITLDLLPADDD